MEMITSEENETVLWTMFFRPWMQSGLIDELNMLQKALL